MSEWEPMAIVVEWLRFFAVMGIIVVWSDGCNRDHVMVVGDGKKSVVARDDRGSSRDRCHRRHGTGTGWCCAAPLVEGLCVRLCKPRLGFRCATRARSMASAHLRAWVHARPDDIGGRYQDMDAGIESARILGVSVGDAVAYTCESRCHKHALVRSAPGGYSELLFLQHDL